ncbi:Aliphatic nitrilase [Paraburkholderia aspalathi]|uniref:carbon-nitrogen hydrolase family protein n=1 Tax=Paraburkholderia aspalathi TaxID=1324617 RepID=UPI00190DB95A|nr:carbon-nitrogen hydrolase family protein [Paraburkholderia aspalathi]MBK3843554.1 carbon-nitrogen hydrolase family protein [Paraburkholderia aspalathi]CAE6855749.1 Aliphatic nitrilase [Paraburkholderia aspalathi]
MIRTPTLIAAAVQTAPVYLDTQATIGKAVRLIHEAAANGARLIAFPEVFVPGYPYWNWIMSPVKGSAWFERLVRQSITVPGPEVDMLCEAARQANAYVVIGVNERPSHSLGTLYNTILTIASDGRLLGRHRKLVPTWAEKLTWGNGDASGLNVHQTEIGPLGALACGENTNTLARFSLLAQGELIHVASYIALPVAPPDYDMAEAIKVRSMAHSFEGKVFTIVSCSTVSEEIVTAMEAECDDARSLLTRRNSAFSGVIGPDGRVVGKPLIDEEGIVYAEVDLARCIQPKQMHDIVGHYNRFDIFDLRVNKSAQCPAQFNAPFPDARTDRSGTKPEDTVTPVCAARTPLFDE